MERSLNYISNPQVACLQPGVISEYLSPDLKILNNLQTLIEQNFRTIHNHEFYANKLHLTIVNLNTITRFHLHKTVYQILQSRLHQEARQLLQTTVLSAKEIGYELSFCDPSYFLKWFKKVEGCTARQYRAWNLNKTQNI